MKTVKIITFTSRIFILIAALYMLSIGILAIFSPLSIIDFVHINMLKHGSFFAISGVYGAGSLLIFILLMYFMASNPDNGLLTLLIYCGIYASIRVMTLFLEGVIGEKESQWLILEFFLFLVSLGLFSALEISKTTEYILSKA